MKQILTEIIQDFRPIKLADMDKVKLMNRVDTKSVTTIPVLLRFLEAAKNDYMVVENEGLRNLPYSTCYFDTEDCDMYHQHERGRLTRQKIRMRIYEHTNHSFLEVKRKNNKGRTKKKRVTAPYKSDINDYAAFLEEQSNYRAADITPHLENHFNRITLVNNNFTERLTIDTSLCFHNFITGKEESLEGLVIIELKRDGNTFSPATALFRELRIKRSGFSKYCIGMSLTDRSLRQNRFKAKIRRVGKLLARDLIDANNN